ncbi:hypothetical protein FA15DRAFT_668188 [Coprinopsis marcescibilis]|uniref:Uncharacterized protein n=1 Tax=Coprinopsis marcescibilis TaxID=230819 RepID=A0A5C3KZF3_COPMA|nr:hypothetical protein FA15DRAFT_668188 [Coprinopsis marcescibilis]
MSRRAGVRRQRPSPIITNSQSASPAFEDTDFEETIQRGRLFRRIDENLPQLEEPVEKCSYVVVRRETIYQAVGRIIYIPSSPSLIPYPSS